MNSAAVFKILDVVMVDREKRTVPLSPKYAYNVALNVV